MSHLEIEVKFQIDDLQAIRDRLVQIGAQGERRVFETNIRYEDPHKGLLSKNCLLRLRRDTRNILTYKSKAPQPDKRYKIHTEIEVEVSSFESMQQILESLGYHQAQVYEKWRETYRLEEVVFCLDTMPFGTFLEIESNTKNIETYAEKMNLEWPRRITLNYLEMFGLLKKHCRLPFQDITFENFKAVEIESESTRRLFQTHSA